ncbi:hypothetical protein QFC22_006507 [Naganishia vaughanmartiniae]|uniref:Uncharacterized protein n=1 Tax=Naganishia vaughanmartiniae TaxID=1424756 RepID=A0ACC2WJX1_9TREE|nr:hypothetical protein QFC22_006507 [Naganishia vaughanmartiniae]
MPLSHHRRCLPSSFFDATLAKPMGKGQIRGVPLVNFEDGCAFPQGSGFSSSSSGLSFSLDEELREAEVLESPSGLEEMLPLLGDDLDEELIDEADGRGPLLLDPAALEDDEAVPLLAVEEEGARLLLLPLEEVEEGRVLLEDPALREDETAGSLELDDFDLELELLDEADDLELEERLLDVFLSSSGGGLACIATK